MWTAHGDRSPAGRTKKEHWRDGRDRGRCRQRCRARPAEWSKDGHDVQRCSDDRAAERADTPVAVRAEAKPDPRASNAILPWAWPVTVDRSRDALLTDFGRETLKDRYLLPGESYQDLFARVAAAYADDAPTPSGCTIISRSCGSCRRPRSCRTAAPGAACRSRATSTSVGDSLDGIVATWNENVWLAARGGGIGTYWGHVRGIGEPVGLNGKTSGIIPFVRVMDSLTLAISQGSLRRGSAAVYLDVSHPEIEEFLEIRKPSRRLQPQGFEPPPRRAGHRRVHGSGARRRGMAPRRPRPGSAPRSMPAACSRSWSRRGWRPASRTSSSPTT